MPTTCWKLESFKFADRRIVRRSVHPDRAGRELGDRIDVGEVDGAVLVDGDVDRHLRVRVASCATACSRPLERRATGRRRGLRTERSRRRRRGCRSHRSSCPRACRGFRSSRLAPPAILRPRRRRRSPRRRWRHITDSERRARSTTSRPCRTRNGVDPSLRERARTCGYGRSRRDPTRRRRARRSRPRGRCLPAMTMGRCLLAIRGPEPSMDPASGARHAQ